MPQIGPWPMTSTGIRTAVMNSASCRNVSSTEAVTRCAPSVDSSSAAMELVDVQRIIGQDVAASVVPGRLKTAETRHADGQVARAQPV